MSMQRLCPPAPSLPVHEDPFLLLDDPFLLADTATTRHVETQALAAVQPGETSLMQRAGHALYRLIMARYPHAQNIWVLAGAGNNGGDAIVAAAWLHKASKQVHVTWLGSPAQMSSDTAKAVAAAQQAGLTLHPLGSEVALPAIELMIDGLLGIGLTPDRPVSTEIAQIIDAINQLPAPVVAVDLPSGLIADTGAIAGCCVQADTTLTFLCAKPGLFTAEGRAYSGEIWLDTLDMALSAPFPPAARLWTGVLPHPPRAHNTHKGSFGDVAVVGGADSMTGAAILAARAAIGAGAGRVYVCLLTQSPAATALDTLHPELMFRAIQQLDVSKLTVACGCGAGQEVAHVLPKLLRKCPRLLLDADALNAIAADAALQQLLKARAPMQMTTVITPHPLEAARLLNITVDQVQTSRLKTAKTLAQHFGCICVLKGSGTIIATSRQISLINISGNAALSTAGTGDVLAGWLTGRWSAFPDEVLQHNIACGVWQHGDAADRWQQAGHTGPLPASQLIDWLLST